MKRRKRPTKEEAAAAIELRIRQRRPTWIRCSLTHEAVISAELLVRERAIDPVDAAAECAREVGVDGPTVLHYLRERLECESVWSEEGES